MVTENDSLETIREHFTHDQYATRAQCRHHLKDVQAMPYVKCQ